MSTTFEQSMATLAENRLAAQHSDLLPYRRGFVLFDFNEDEGTALGVYRFMIGNVPAMMPVVIDKGSVDGMDIIILRDLSLFVPALDGWIAALASMGPRDLGSLKEAGPSAKGASSVVLQFGRFPYAVKSAESILTQAEFDSFFSAFHTIDRDKAVAAYTGKPMETVLPSSSLGCRVIAKTAESDPVFHERFIKTYGEALLKTARLKRGTNPNTNLLHVAEPEEDKLYTITDIDDAAAASLNPSEKRRLLKTGQFVIDKRAVTEVADVYDMPQLRSLQTVSLPGPYKLLTHDGSFVEGMVLIDRTPKFEFYQGGETPQSPGQVASKVWFVPSGAKQPCRMDAQALWVQPGKADLEEGDQVSINGIKDYATKMHSEDIKEYPDSKAPSTYFQVLVAVGKEAVELGLVVKDNEIRVGDLNVVISPDFKSFRAGPATFFIPEDAKMWLLGRGYSDKQKDVVVPGRPENMRDRILKETSGKSLTINMTGKNVKIDGDCLTHIAESENEAIEVLAYDAGISAPAAVKLIQRVAQSKDRELMVIVKQAEPLGPVDVTTITQKPPLYTETPGSMSDLNKWSDRTEKTADVGDNDEFDKALMDEVLSMTDFREVGLDQIRALTEAMDQCGKLLLRVLVHKDAYIERYSEEDADRLETSCRKQFMGNGDVVLFLREKRGGGGADDEVLVDLLTSDMGS